MQNFKEKYLKYKLKYNNLKKKHALSIDSNNNKIIKFANPVTFVNQCISERKLVFDQSINFFPIELPENITVRANLEKVKTVGGGTCLLHSILLALSPIIQKLSEPNREECGNSYRSMLATNMEIDFDTEERKSLRNNDKPIKVNPPEVAADSTKYILDELDNSIWQKLLNKLNINLIIINDTEHIPGPVPSEYNKKTNTHFIIIYARGAHFELVKKKGTTQTLYTREDLKTIFSDDILNTEPIFFGGKIMNAKQRMRHKITLEKNRLLEIELNPETFANECVKSNNLEKIALIKFPTLPWPETFRTKHLERVKTIGGGSCLLHAILLAISPTVQQLSNLDKEEIGNLYRKKLANTTKKEINFNEMEKLELENYGEEPVPSFVDDYKYALQNLSINIGFKLLEKLKYNLVLIQNVEHTNMLYIQQSPLAHKEFNYFIIIYGDGFHFSMVKKRHTNQTVYTRGDLRHIISDEILDGEKTGIF
jgi:hypothetical protein